MPVHPRDTARRLGPLEEEWGWLVVRGFFHFLRCSPAWRSASLRWRALPHFVGGFLMKPRP